MKFLLSILKWHPAMLPKHTQFTFRICLVSLTPKYEINEIFLVERNYSLQTNLLRPTNVRRTAATSSVLPVPCP